MDSESQMRVICCIIGALNTLLYSSELEIMKFSFWEFSFISKSFIFFLKILWQSFSWFLRYCNHFDHLNFFPLYWFQKSLFLLPIYPKFLPKWIRIFSINRYSWLDFWKICWYYLKISSLLIKDNIFNVQEFPLLNFSLP